MQEVHRSGPLKQKNKAHFTLGHKSNRLVKTSNGGRINNKTLSKRNKLLEKRNERKDRLINIRKNKRQNAFNLKRSIGQIHNAPLIVTIMYLSANRKNRSENINKILKFFTECDNEIIVNQSENGNLYLTLPKLKLRYNFLAPDFEDLFANMDAVKVTDVLLCVYDALEEDQIECLKKDTESILNSVYYHCLPTTIHSVFNINEIPIKKRSDVKKLIQKQISSMFPDEKIHSLDSPQEALQLLNIIGNCKKKRLAFRERRSQILIDKIEFSKDNNSETGILKAYGFVKNKTLDVNKIIHIPGYGNYLMDEIKIIEDPYKISQKKGKEVENEMETDEKECKVFKPDPIEQESLQQECEIDELDQEQSIINPEDIVLNQEEQLKKKKIVPKGTSDYQAAWLVDDDEYIDEEDGSDYEDESEFEDALQDMEPVENLGSDEEDLKSEYAESVLMDQLDNENYQNENYDEKLDLNEEMETLQKINEERQNEMYPDEVDTPLDKPARVRFARYRGLKSFHKSAWDPKENLPLDYSRIFQFQNFNRSKKVAIEESDLANGPEAGQYVVVSLRNFSEQIFNHLKNKREILILYQLLKYEQKMSVMNIILRKHPNFSQPIKSKERLIFHVGCRRFGAKPIFSVHSNGDKHKYEKFLRSDIPIVASLYAPITFAPASVCVFKEFADGSHQLVATGSVLNMQPNRIVVKRLILSGHPYKIHKTFSVVRYMFFNREDILWFKPIELRTKFGRKGHIKEPLGTHGHMKCTFDRGIRSNDTILMNLYKRVYPKWTYEGDVNKLNCRIHQRNSYDSDNLDEYFED